MKKVMLMLLLLTASVFSMSLNKLNSASKEELMQINGIGEKKAEAIIKERRKGKFKSFEDLQRVEGIGEKMAKNIKNDVKVKQKPKASKKKKSDKKSTVKKKTAEKKSKTKKKTTKSAPKKHEKKAKQKKK
jgi:competence protein ComEA